MYPGIIPILHSSGLIIPGQLGPITLDLFWDLRACFTLTISCWGIPKLIHVLTVSNNNNKLDFSFDGFEDGVSCGRWRNINDTSIALGMFFSLFTILEDGETQVSGTSFFGGDTTNHFGSVFESLLSLESALHTSKRLLDFQSCLGR